MWLAQSSHLRPMVKRRCPPKCLHCSTFCEFWYQEFVWWRKVCPQYLWKSKLFLTGQTFYTRTYTNTTICALYHGSRIGTHLPNQLYFKENVVRQMPIFCKYFQRFFYYQCKKIEKNNFSKILAFISRIILCQICYMATVFEWTSTLSSWGKLVQGPFNLKAVV
jgi:hypothetical protein